jgi:hypothetical protein
MGDLIKYGNIDTYQLLRFYEVLEDYLPREFINQALGEYGKNDSAHLQDHAINVVLHADKITERFPELTKHRHVILTAALLHDVKCHVNRDKHHILGALAVYRQYIKSHFTTRSFFRYEEVTMIEEAVLEHRASWKHKRSHDVSEAVAAADRGKPELMSYLRRAVRYRYAQLPEGVMAGDAIKNNIIAESLVHVREKFGTGGYAWETMPKYTLMMYEKEITVMKEAVMPSNLDNTRTKALDLFDGWVS